MMTDLTGKSLQFSWYFQRLPTVESISELIIALADTQPLRPNRMTLTDSNFKDKKRSYKPATLQPFLEQVPLKEILGVHIYSFVKGEENRIPRSYIILAPISYDEPFMYVLSVSVDFTTIAEADLITAKWVEIVESRMTWDYGFGSISIRMNLDLNYGYRHLTHAENPTKDYEIAARNIQFFRKNSVPFLSVIHGKSALSIFHYNLLTRALYNLIKKRCQEVSKPVPGKIKEISATRVLWSLDSTSEQKALFEALSGTDLVFDPEWFNLDGYVPVHQTFGIPFE
jgi:hypothetical protein